MKNLAIIAAVSVGLLTFKTADAQIRLHVNLNFGQPAIPVVVAQPVPVQANYADYDGGDDYYYLPDVEAYYNVPQHCYYYNDGERWISTAYLPGRYHDFDWRTARRYEVRAERPYMHHDTYRTRFGGFGQQRGGDFDNRYANRGDFDRNRGTDIRAWGGDNQGNRYRDNRGNDGRGWNGNNRGGQYDNANRDNNQSRGNDQQGQGRGGNYSQPQNGGGQYQNGGQQGNGRGSNGGNQQNQPSNQKGGQDKGNRGDEHFAANKMGIARPNRF